MSKEEEKMSLQVSISHRLPSQYLCTYWHVFVLKINPLCCPFTKGQAQKK